MTAYVESTSPLGRGGAWGSGGGTWPAVEAVPSHSPCAGRGAQHPPGPEVRFDQEMAPSRPFGDYDFIAECARLAA